MIHHKNKEALRPLVLALTWTITTALADGPATSTLDPVVVSATRSEQSSFTLPMSVDAVGGDRLRDGQVGVNLSETLNRIPGLTIQNRQNYAQDLQVSIRGFGSRSTFGTRGIRLLVDDIPASSPDGQGQAANFDLDNAQRIEVLRGPFATLYGNASGGVIRAITRDGPARPEVSAGLITGSFGTQKGTIEAGGTEGSVNYLIDSSQFTTHGYRDHSLAKRQQTNAKFSVPTDAEGKLTLVVNMLAQPDAQDPTGLTAAEVAANPRQADIQAKRWNSRKTLNTEQVGANYQRHLDADDDLQMTLYTGARRVLQYLAASPTAVAANASFFANGVVDLDRQFGGTDLHVTHRGSLLGGRTELNVGASYELQNENRKSFGSVRNQGTTQEGTLSRFEDDEVTAANTYIEGQWAVRPDVLVVGGLRHSLVEFSTAAYIGSVGGSAQYANTSPAIAVSYQPVQTISVYANYGRGFETPAFSELSYSPVFNAAHAVTGFGPSLNYGLRPSTSDNYETGVKTLLDSDTRANAAVFEIVTRDELAVLANVSGRSYYQNVPGTRRTGAELSIEHDLSHDLTAYAAYTWLNAIYSSAFTGSAPVQAGNHLPGVGRRIAYGELSWHSQGFSTAVEGRYSDKVYANDTNTAAAGNFAVFNIRAELNQTARNWTLAEFARVDNVFSRVYSGSVIVNDANQRYYEPSPTRSVSVGVRARYDFL